MRSAEDLSWCGIVFLSASLALSGAPSSLGAAEPALPSEPASSVEPAPAPDAEGARFTAWMVHTGEALRMDWETFGLIVNRGLPERKGDDPELCRRLQFSELAHWIASDDRRLRRYLSKLHATRQKRGKFNDYDLRVLQQIWSADIGGKQAVVDDFKRLSRQWGVRVPEGAVDGAKSILPPHEELKEGDKRYDPETGLEESYDVKTGRWGPPVSP
jgi:hypothetical protein